MVPVRFVRPFDIYNCGEVAGFPREQAERLVRSGIATPYASEAVAPAAVEKPAEAETKPASAEITKPARTRRK